MMIQYSNFVALVCMTLTPAATQGFVPPRPGFTSVQTMATSPTVLHANLFDRFTRVVKGNMNNMLQKWEDPEKVMNQALNDMQSDIVKVRQTYAEVTATQRRLGSQRAQYEAVADDWYRKAQLALKRGQEDLARAALARREQALEQAKAIEAQMEAQESNLESLFRGMQTLEGKILEAKSKKNQMAARARTAKSTQMVNDMLSGLTGKTSMDAFNRMEEKVEALEAAAEVSAEMASNSLLGALMPAASDGSKKTNGSLEMQFKALESSDAVENELEKLKANMLPESSSVSRRIPVTAASESRLEEVEYSYLK